MATVTGGLAPFRFLTPSFQLLATQTENATARVYPGGAMFGNYKRPHRAPSVRVAVVPPAGGTTATLTEPWEESLFVVVKHRSTDAGSVVAFSV